jgi:hypothetical protein
MLHPQAQKLLVAMKGTSYTPRIKDIIAAHKFSLYTHHNVRDGGVNYLKVSTKCDALYPFIGTTLGVLAFNLVNIGTAQSNYYLTFVGSPTPTAGGGSVPWITPQYANTHISASTVSARSNCLGYYSLSNNNSGQDIGLNKTSIGPYLILRNFLSNFSTALNGAPITAPSPAPTNSLGMFLSFRVGTTNTIKSYKDGVIISNVTNNVYTNALITSGTVFVGAVQGSIATVYSHKDCAGAIIGSNFTENEAISLSNAFLNLNTLK